MNDAVKRDTTYTDKTLDHVTVLNRNINVTKPSEEKTNASNEKNGSIF